MTSTVLNKRCERRELIQEFYSVEFSIDGIDMINQFVIYDMSTSGFCLLIKEDSLILSKIYVGEQYKLKYHPVNLLGQVKYLDTKIRHITKSKNNSLSGHVMVGLSIENNG